jgi:hypothetical protein
MDEAEWLACDDPIDMLLVPPGNGAADRKARLFACACCRRVWDVMSPGNRAAVEAAERFADGLVTAGELRRQEGRSAVYRDVDDERLPEDLPHSYWCDVAAWKATSPRAAAGADDVSDATRRVARDRCGEWEEVVQARLLRCVVGNPFRPVPPGPWITPAAVTVAREAYDRRDFSALPLLADLLEEAGCPEQSVLDHCRQPGEHVRGCWVVDLALGKS